MESRIPTEISSDSETKPVCVLPTDPGIDQSALPQYNLLSKRQLFILGCAQLILWALNVGLTGRNVFEREAWRLLMNVAGCQHSRNVVCIARYRQGI